MMKAIGKFLFGLKEQFVNWLLRGVHLREVRFGDHTVTVTDRVTMTTVAPAVAGEIGMDTTTGRPQAYVGGTAKALATIVDAPSGTWTQLGKGPTSVADNTEVTVLADQALSAGEIPMFLFVMKTTPSGDQQHHYDDTSVGTGGNMTHGAWVKKTTGNVDFRLRHGDGAARDFDWTAYKVTPA